MKRDTILRLVCVASVTVGLIIGTRVLEAQYGPTTPEGGQITYNGGGIWIGQNANNGVGFYGVTPAAQQTVAFTATTAGSLNSTAANTMCSNILTALKLYGLVK